MDSVGLYKKMYNVMSEISYLAKDGKISFGNQNYKTISEEKVTSKVKEKLVQHGLIIFPIEQTSERNGNLTSTNTKYKIVDIDTGASEILVSSGQGADSQDKGVGKAMSYSYKYMLLRTFAIPSGEDPDKISSKELDEKLNDSDIIDPKNVIVNETDKDETNEEVKKPEFSKEQKSRISNIKKDFKIKTNDGLNKYVKFWADKNEVEANNYKDLNPDTIDNFCNFIEERGKEVVPF